LRLPGAVPLGALARERIEASLQHSLEFAADDDQQQAGLAPIVADYATSGWLCNVLMDEAYRGYGIGKWLMQTILARPNLQAIKRLVLVTIDARGPESQYGFTPVENSGGWMERSGLQGSAA
jgi:N-acetylglutamate synthase-like GNAT family acetyltransferase